jgi:hypothetical protein
MKRLSICMCNGLKQTGAVIYDSFDKCILSRKMDMDKEEEKKKKKTSTTTKTKHFFEWNKD